MGAPKIYGTCETPGCSEPATCEILQTGENVRTGEPVEIRAIHCESHLAAAMPPKCANDFCAHVGTESVPFAGTGALDGKRHEGTLYFCPDCIELFRREQIITVDGHAMLHDGKGNMKRLPGQRPQG